MNAGLRFSGFSRDGLVEIIELPAHPFFIASQYHPEFRSTPRDGHAVVYRLHPCGARLARDAVAGGRWRMSSAVMRSARSPVLPDRGSLRRRERGAGDRGRRPAQGDHRAAWDSVRLQGVLRQGQPLVASQLPRARYRAGAQGAREGARADPRTGAHGRARGHAARGGRAVVDVLQTPAFLCRQTNFIVNTASQGKPVNIKKGQFLSPWEMRNVVDKARSTGNREIMVCERGFQLRL